ncbi:hypothetical protein B0O80DRAFT_528565 [Mortierella sp. GBAus27b]|nr:hypothetical protein B0O80DRAFT_528565 [Mortierella sp. GBAus27b]
MEKIRGFDVVKRMCLDVSFMDIATTTVELKELNEKLCMEIEKSLSDLEKFLTMDCVNNEEYTSLIASVVSGIPSSTTSEGPLPMEASRQQHASRLSLPAALSIYGRRSIMITYSLA